MSESVNQSEIPPAYAGALPLRIETLRWAVRVRTWAFSRVAGLLSSLLGAADGRTVAAMALRELNLTVRSRHWHRFFGMWMLICSTVVLLPILVRSRSGSWIRPTNEEWFVYCGLILQLALAGSCAQWCIRRFRRDVYTHRLDELILTRCSAADIAMGEALAAAIASLWMVAAAFPACCLVAGIGGVGMRETVLLILSMIPASALGVWFGMGWGLSFTGRRSALSSLTDWWLRVPFFPVWVAWAILGLLPVFWALLSLIPGGLQFLTGVVALAQLAIRWSLWNLNPLLVVPSIVGMVPTIWLTSWLVLVVLVVVLMRKSMDAIQAVLAVLPEAEDTHAYPDVWVHHDVHYFVQYGADRRREPRYREGGNPITAFDAALGHRIFLHPFFWALGLHLYFFLTGWSLMFPHHGLFTGTAAVLFPATGALLLMSGGVAVSFGWERDQDRWPALAVLPLDDWKLAWGKINGVVRPTLWIGLVSAPTALLLGWRGALPWESALWMALHVITFPVALAGVSALLALTTPTVGEALYRWAVLGSLPLAASLLPHPIGGDSGLALPFSPPLLILLLVVKGATPELVRTAWISLGLEVVGVVSAVWLLDHYLRRWTVGERG